MNAILNKTAIIILAESHNPTIVSPEWLRDKGIMDEKPTNFAHTPVLSIFESESCQILVDQNRFQMTPKNLELPCINRCQKATVDYVTALPETPYTAIGLNYTWQVNIGENADNNIIKLSFAGSNIENSFEGYEDVLLGGKLTAKKENYVLQLIIDPSDKSILSFHFNFHFDTKGKGFEFVNQCIAKYISNYDVSKQIIEKIIKGGK